MPKTTQPSTALPKGWPPATVYLTAPKYSPQINPQLLQLNATTTSTSNTATAPLKIAAAASKPQAPCPLVRIKPITNPTHPANGQHGLFATQNLPPDTFILTYLGYVHDSAETDPASDYDLVLDAELGIAVDAARMGNEARFINDYRGVSTSTSSSGSGSGGPNVEFRDVLVDVGSGVLEKRIGVFVLSAGKSKAHQSGGKTAKGVLKGEEILLSYGKGFWKGRREE